MSTNLERKEGVDNSPLQIFGDPASIGDSHFMIRLEHKIGRQIEYSLNYRILDDNFIQLILIVDEEPISIIAQFRLAGKSLKEELSRALEKFFRGLCFFEGFPEFRDSVFLTGTEYNGLIHDLECIRTANTIIALENKSRLIRYMDHLGMEPTPFGWDTSGWYAECFGSAIRHPLLVSAATDEWECTCCNRHGDYEALEKWLVALDNQILSRYHKAINSGNGIPEFLGRWWENRY